jgi:hypothetical protein
MNLNPFRVREIWSGNLFQFTQTQILLPALKLYIESEIGELGFYQSLREMNRILLRVRDIKSGNLLRFRKTETLLPAHKWYTRIWSKWIRFLPISKRDESDFFFRFTDISSVKKINIQSDTDNTFSSQVVYWILK